MLPGFVEPALAALVATPPATAAWRHEVKFDGYRLLVRIQAGGVQMFTRSGLDWTAKFASLVQPMLALPVREAMLDGEAVVIGEDGASSFGGLQQALSEGAHERIQLYLFDALFIDGEDLRPHPLDARRTRLERLLLRRRPGKARVLLSEVFDMPGRTVLAQACALGLEGIVSKRRDAPYRSGRRGDWLKSKCLKGQEIRHRRLYPIRQATHAISVAAARRQRGGA